MSRRHSMISLVVVIVLLCVGLAGAWAAEAKRGGTLRIGYWQDMTGMDPQSLGRDSCCLRHAERVPDPGDPQ
jgi:hypothetical protein